MLKISNDDKAFLKNYIENLDALIVTDNLRELLINIHNLEVLEGFDNQEFLNPLGEKLEEIYERIYEDN